MAIRLRDIAKDLNLSAMTISKVLRGQTDVSAETKARVLKRAQELNYRPNITARSLRTGQTRSVGLVVPRLEGVIFPEFARAIGDALRKESYSLLLACADNDSDNEEREVELHLSRQVDAMVFCLREDAFDMPQALKQASIPVVLIGLRPAQASALSVGVREEEVGSLAANHLLQRRSRRLAFLRGPRTAAADLRYAGFREALREGGVASRPEWTAELGSGQSSFASARDAVTAMMASLPRPDGIVCASDLAAAGACVALREARCGVPDQVQVIGIGNATEVCEPFALTSVDLSSAELGRRAARVVMRLIQDRSTPSVRRISISPTVIARATTREQNS